MSIQIALLIYFPYKLSSLVAKKIKSKALAADGTKQTHLEDRDALVAVVLLGQPHIQKETTFLP